MSHEYTEDEVRDMFLRHVWDMINYWDEVKENKREAMEGLAFSLLAALDGGVPQLPAFIVCPIPNGEDKDYLISQGQNWFPPFDGDDPCDIAGVLHELFYKAKP